MELREYLEEYRTLTLNLMESVKKDEEVTSLIIKREVILKSIDSLNFDKEEIKKIGTSLSLLELEEELENVVKREKVDIKKQIEALKKLKQANTKYNSIEDKARILNKSI